MNRIDEETLAIQEDLDPKVSKMESNLEQLDYEYDWEI